MEEWKLVSQIRHSDSKRAIQIAKVAYESANGYTDAWRWRFGIRYAELLLDLGDRQNATVEIQRIEARPAPQGLTLAEKTARLLSAQGYLLFSNSDWKAAERLFEQALTGLPQIKDDSCWEAELRVHQAQSFRHLLKFSAASESLQEAQKPAQLCSDKNWVAVIPFTMGNCYNDQFHFEEAVQSFQECYRVAGSYGVSQVMGKTFGNMGLCYYNLGDTDKALEMFDKADVYYKRLGTAISNKDLSDHGSDVGHEARTHFLLNNYDKAESKYKEAIEIATKTRDYRYLPRWRAELASLYTEKGDYRSAETLNESVLKDEHKDVLAIEIARLNKARLDRLQGRFKEAKIDLDEWQSESTAKEEANKIQWEVHIERAQLLSVEKRNREANGEFRSALMTADAARSGIRSSDYRLTYFLQLKGTYEKYVQFLIADNQPNEALRVAEAGHARMLAEKLNHSALASPTIDFLKIARAKNAVILSYSMTTNSSYMWITTADATRMFTLPAGSFEKVEKLIAVHNNRIRDQQQPIQGDQGGPQLYNLLVAPVAQWIPPKSNVIIIPDGSLSSLNFETLIPPGNKPHYWIEDVTVTVSPSLAQLSSEAQPKRDPASILLVGDVVPTSQEKLPPLSADDVDFLNKLYPSSDVLKKGEATPSSFLKKAKNRPYSWIYVSAHAISNPQSPLDSYVVLSPETKGGDYKLPARALAELGLRASLVTLSACQSAGAKNIPGEGLVGLSWAMLSAGARNVVASLWPVEANSTSKLMKKFYTHLHEHETPEQALRKAKLEMANERNLPYSWAAFQLYSR